MDNFFEGPLPEPATRTTKDMIPVLAGRGSLPDTILYYMYRDLVKSESDRRWLSSRRLRFDLTRMPAGTVMGEFVKTKGHYHPTAPDGHGYPELYQVIRGHANYLLQKEDLSDILVVGAGPGDIVLVPPGYGHVTINPSPEELLMSNIVSDAFSSIYGYYERMHGAAYYEFETEGWKANPAYGEIPAIRTAKPKPLDKLGIPGKKSIYDLVGNDDALNFLNSPSILDGHDIIP